MRIILRMFPCIFTLCQILTLAVSSKEGARCGMVSVKDSHSERNANSLFFQFYCNITLITFETVPNAKKLQTTAEMWLSKNFMTKIAQKTLWKKVKLLILSNFTFFPPCFPKAFFFNVLK